MAPTISPGAGSIAPENVIVSTSIGAQRKEPLGPQLATPGHVELVT
jgi:hypothetical protein